MGNRAVIATSTAKTSVGIYLHWNGGPESVDAFLEAARRYGLSPSDRAYFTARLAQIIGNFFGGTSSLGVGRLDDLDCDNYDNGLYIVGKNGRVRAARAPLSASSRAYDKSYYEGVLHNVLEANRPFFEPEDKREAA